MIVIRYLICFAAMGVFFRCGEQLDTVEGFPDPTIESNEITPTLSQLNIREPFNYNDFENVLEEAKKEKRPILIDFTGYACVNCRKMEDNVWLSPDVYQLLKNEFIIISLYVDNRWGKIPKPITTSMVLDENGDAIIGPEIPEEVPVGISSWLDYQRKRYKKETQPLYDIVDGNNNSLVNETATYRSHMDSEIFKSWLEEGLSNLKNK